MKTLFGLFLIAHALIHSSFITKAPAQQPGAPIWPFDITKSWILNLNPETLKVIGIVLTVVATVGFIASGLGWLGIPVLKTYWVSITVISAISSILLIVIYWNNWFVMGPIIDLVILYLVFYKNIRP